MATKYGILVKFDPPAPDIWFEYAQKFDTEEDAKLVAARLQGKVKIVKE